MRKGLLTINHYEIPNHLNFQFVADRFAGLLRALLPFWIVFPLAGLGAVVAWSRGGSLARFLSVAGATCLGVPVLFFVTARYRLPAFPFLLVLAGGGAAWLVAQVQARAWRWVVGGAGLTILLLLPTRLHLVREGDFAFDHLILGEVHRQLGNLDEAVLEFKLARETGLPTSDASYRLATVLEERGNLEAPARACWCASSVAGITPTMTCAAVRPPFAAMKRACQWAAI